MLYKLSLIILVIVCISCSKEEMEYDKMETFNELHSSIARYSASIDSRNIDWNRIGNVYRNRVSENLSETEYFNLISELLREFRDPHVWLLSPEQSMFTIDFLGYDRNYDEAVVKGYLTNIQQHSDKIFSGRIDDRLGYLFLADFRGDEKVNDEIYSTILQNFENTDGLIIDIRENDGGSVYNAQYLLNKLSNERKLWHTTQNRTSEGFDEKYNWYIEPDANHNYQKPVIVLTGRYTISAGERFAIGATLLDNITLVGDTTANTQGSVVGREMLNGWRYTFTFEKCLDPDGTNYAGIGVPPDYVWPSGNSITGNKDRVLEQAIILLQ